MKIITATQVKYQHASFFPFLSYILIEISNLGHKCHLSHSNKVSVSSYM